MAALAATIIIKPARKSLPSGMRECQGKKLLSLVCRRLNFTIFDIFIPHFFRFFSQYYSTSTKKLV